MSWFDDFDPGQVQDGGGLLGLLRLGLPQANASQSGAGVDPQDPNNAQPTAPADASDLQAAPSGPDLGTRLGSGFQGWAQTPVGSPFAALTDGIKGFNNAQPSSTADGSFIGPPAPTPDLGTRLGAAVQSWAQTPAGSPFAGLANGITGFNTGQVMPAAAMPARVQTSADSAQPNTVAPGQNVPAANVANPSARRIAVLQKWPLWPPR